MWGISFFRTLIVLIGTVHPSRATHGNGAGGYSRRGSDGEALLTGTSLYLGQGKAFMSAENTKSIESL